MEKPHIAVFYGSARPNAAAPKVATWLKGKLAHETAMTFEYIDLATLDLPIMNTAGAIEISTTPTLPSLALWSTAIEKADGFIAIVNEYNHAPSAITKNAIDYLKVQWAHKPVAFVSYGGVMGGSRAVEHLRQVFVELEATTVRDQISIQHVYSQFNEQGVLNETSVSGDLIKMLKNLLWWTEALRVARNKA